ncbi:MAG: trypsin-like peptidase domain-containing protein [Clostridia bacterium]|nr:trypsin-like peptidase domain-containing protein [Clostridia bacterium]
MLKKKNKPKKLAAISNDQYIICKNENNQFVLKRVPEKRKPRTIAFAYVIALFCVFVLSLAVLFSAFLWALQKQTNVIETQPQTNQNQQQETQQQETQKPQPALTTTAIAEMLNPAVVFIQAADEDSASSGTGFFISSDGYIVTNHHVIEDALRIQVTLYDGTDLSATVVGYRAEDDIAVLKVEGNNYPTVQIGDSNALKPGDVAVIVGHPSGEDGKWSTTQGVISALNRVLSIEEASYFCEIKMIQTDATANPGNSGGPLCNDRGEVVGIITRKKTDYEGMNYAIPITEAMLTVDAILNGKLDGFVSSVSQSRPKIGVTGVEILKGDVFVVDRVEYTAPVPGFWVSEVSQNSNAYGIIQVGDIICGLNGVTVSDFDTFKAELYKCYVGQTVTFELYRKNQKMTVQVTIGVSQ